MEDNNLAGALEAILFVYADPIDVDTLCHALSISMMDCNNAIEILQNRYTEQDSGLCLRRIENCIQLCTSYKYAQQVEQVLTPVQTKKLSKAVLETLSIIAYKQPVTRLEIEEIRGVRCEYAIVQLLKQDLIMEAGYRNTLGKPTVFQTTHRFLQLFGIESLDSLPPLEMTEPASEFEGI